MQKSPREPLRPAVGLLGLISSIGLLMLLVSAALLTTRGQALDQRAMQTVSASRDTELTVLSGLGRVSIGSVLLVTTFCVILALMRGRLDLAIAAVGIIAAANIVTQALKHIVLMRPDFGFGALNSLPSGHTTVVASGVAALVLVAPRGLRSVLAFAGAFAVSLTGASTVVAAWHRPSDVLAALCVVAACVSAAALLLRGGRRLTFGEASAALMGGGMAVVALAVIGTRPRLGWAGVFDASVVLGAIAVCTAVFVMLVCAAVPGPGVPQFRSSSTGQSGATQLEPAPPQGESAPANRRYHEGRVP